MAELKCLVAAVTIFDENGKVDVEGNRKMYEYYLSQGLTNIVILGSTGEFYSMSLAEKKKLIDVAVEALDGKARLLVGASGMVLEEVIEVANYAYDKGVRTVMAIGPYYFKLNPKTIVDFYSAFAAECKADIMIYNLPMVTGYDMSPEIVLELKEKHDNFKGYKDTTSDIWHTRKIINQVKSKYPDFEVYTGYDDSIYPMALSGGDGIISALSPLAPQTFHSAIEAWNKSDTAGMVAAQKHIDSMMALYDSEASAMYAVKKMLVQAVGLDVSDACRLPIGTTNQERIDSWKDIVLQKN